MAVIHGYIAIVELLLKHNADPPVVNARQESPLQQIIKESGVSYLLEDKQNQIVTLLLDYGADANIQFTSMLSDKIFNYLLHLAGLRQNDEMVRLLLMHSANHNIFDWRGNMPLHT